MSKGLAMGSPGSYLGCGAHAWVWLSLRGVASGSGQPPAVGRWEQPALAGRSILSLTPFRTAGPS